MLAETPAPRPDNARALRALRGKAPPPLRCGNDWPPSRVEREATAGCGWSAAAKAGQRHEAQRAARSAAGTWVRRRRAMPHSLLGTPHIHFLSLIIIGGLAGWIAGMVLGWRHASSPTFSSGSSAPGSGRSSRRWRIFSRAARSSSSSPRWWARSSCSRSGARWKGDPAPAGPALVGLALRW